MGLESKHIAIAGGTGLVGSHVCKMLESKGHRVSILTRKPGANDNNRILWNPEKESISSFEGCDVLINLAGAGIVDKPWTDDYKSLITKSRINSVRTLDKYIKLWQKKPSTYVNASAIGIYGTHGSHVFQEGDKAFEKDFMVEVVEEWEKAVHQMNSNIENRFVFRIGLVLTTDGGVYAKMNRPAMTGVSGYFGNGDQWYSWIHIDDLASMITAAVEGQLPSGVYNAVSPNPEKASNFAKFIKRWGVVLPIPSFLMKTILGERLKALTNSTRVSANKILKEGFVFHFNTLQEALTDLRSP